MRVKLINYCGLLFYLLLFSTVGCAQRADAPVTKERALKEGKATSAAGWEEVTSEQGRFRILFPGSAVEAGENRLTGYRLVGDGKNWHALFVDFESSPGSDEALRKKYRESAEALTKRGSKLVAFKEVRLNGRLGVEFILLGREAKSYIRAFQINRRLFTLAVDDRNSSDEAADVPEDVRRFFDSFTFWE